MNKYKNILVAADLIDDADEIIGKRALELVETSGAQLTLIHAIEATYDSGEPWQVENNTDWQREMRQSEKDKLASLGEKLNVPAERQIIKTGQMKHAILQTAEEIDANLILIGCHSRQGLGIFLSLSTVSNILQKAKCDVLAVHVDTKRKL